MSLSVDMLADPSRFRHLRDAWNDMVKDDPLDLRGHDQTATYEMFEAIVEALDTTSQARVVVVRDGSEVVGILPLVIRRDNRLGPRLLVASELHSGRNGPLMHKPRADVMEAFVRALDVACPHWISLQSTLVAGTEISKVARAAFSARRHSSITGPERVSPFFPLLESSGRFRLGMSKSVQQLIRTSRNKLVKLGQVRYRAFEDASETDELLEVVRRIERGSWKEAAGTSITKQPYQHKLYQTLFTTAMKSGSFYAVVLYLNEEPIAHVFGLCGHGVFSCLKHSHVQAYDKCSPAYLLKDWLFDQLRERKIVSFDYMGLPSPHKLRWSDQNKMSVRHTTVFFGRSPGGRLAALAARLKSWLAATETSTIRAPTEP